MDKCGDCCIVHSTDGAMARSANCVGGAGPVKESTWIAPMTALPSFATISDETEPFGVSDHDDDAVTVIVSAVSTRL